MYSALVEFPHGETEAQSLGLATSYSHANILWAEAPSWMLFLYIKATSAFPPLPFLGDHSALHTTPCRTDTGRWWKPGREKQVHFINVVAQIPVPRTSGFWWECIEVGSMHFCHLSEDTNHKMAGCGRDEPQEIIGRSIPKTFGKRRW